MAKRYTDPTFEVFFTSPDAERRARVPVEHLIHKCNAHCLWQHDTRNGFMRIECWLSGNTNKMYILTFRNDGGWEIWQQSNPGNDIGATLAEVK